MNTVSLLRRGAALRVFQIGVNAVLPVLIFPLALRALGHQTFGVWILAGTIVGALSIFEVGLTAAVTTFAAKNIAADDEPVNAGVCATAFWLLAAVGATLAIAFSFFDGHLMLRRLIMMMGLGYGFTLKTTLAKPSSRLA